MTANHDLDNDYFCSCPSGSCGPQPPDKSFVPMVWGYLEEDRPWNDDINDPVDDRYEVILGFNEPNHADQSDIPPEVAAAAWIELQNLYPDKVREVQIDVLWRDCSDPGKSRPCRGQHRLVRPFLRGL